MVSKVAGGFLIASLRHLRGTRAMTPSEWRSLAQSVNRDIAGMTRAAATQEGVRAALNQRNSRATEEFFIDEDSFGSQPTQARIFTGGTVELKVWKTHRAGLSSSDIKGADLYYEISDRKFILVQYKTPSRSGRVTLDADQLDELQAACPVQCPPTHRFSCGSWYALRSTGSGSFFTACEAKALFGVYASRDRKYFVNGLAQTRFYEEFGACRIGGRTEPIEIHDYMQYSLEHDRVLINAIQAPASQGDGA